MIKKAAADKINNVEFLGYMHGDRLYQEIKNSLFVVFPSEVYENCPMTVIESFALGLPVIGTNIGGIPELIKNNERGLTFEPRNATDLCEKIKYMIDNPDEALKMGQNARKFAEQELNTEKYYQELMKIYKLASEKGFNK